MVVLVLLAGSPYNHGGVGRVGKPKQPKFVESNPDLRSLSVCTLYSMLIEQMYV